MSVRICGACGQEREHLARGLCAPCYYRRYNEDHRDEISARGARYYAANREAAAARAKRPGRIVVCSECAKVAPLEGKGLCAPCYQRRYQRAHPDKVASRNARYRTKHRTKALITRSVVQSRRRARQHALPATLTVSEWQAILAAHQHRCAYCGRDDVALTQDHVVPVSRGGGTTADNIVPACKPCNSRKGVRSVPRPAAVL